MRIRTDGDYAHRLDAIEAAIDALDENTKTNAMIPPASTPDRTAARKNRRWSIPT
jgi:hypothetical protein